MTTNEYEKAIEIAKDQNFIHRMHHVVNPDDKAPCKFKECTIAQAMLAMHEENEKLKAEKIGTLQSMVSAIDMANKSQADLKEALDVIRFYGDYKKNHCTVVTMNEFMEETEMHHGNAFKVDDGQRAREFLVKHEGKEKE